MSCSQGIYFYSVQYGHLQFITIIGSITSSSKFERLVHWYVYIDIFSRLGLYCHCFSKKLQIYQFRTENRHIVLLFILNCVSKHYFYFHSSLRFSQNKYNFCPFLKGLSPWEKFMTCITRKVMCMPEMCANIYRYF